MAFPETLSNHERNYIHGQVRHGWGRLVGFPQALSAQRIFPDFFLLLEGRLGQYLHN